MSLSEFFSIIAIILTMFSLMILVHYLIDKYKAKEDKWWFTILIFFFVILSPLIIFLRKK